MTRQPIDYHAPVPMPRRNAAAMGIGIVVVVVIAVNTYLLLVGNAVTGLGAIVYLFPLNIVANSALLLAAVFCTFIVMGRCSRGWLIAYIVISVALPLAAIVANLTVLSSMRAY